MLQAKYVFFATCVNYEASISEHCVATSGLHASQGPPPPSRVPSQYNDETPKLLYSQNIPSGEVQKVSFCFIFFSLVSYKVNSLVSKQRFVGMSKLNSDSKHLSLIS